VVVTGHRPRAACQEGDKACLTEVAVEVWTKFPKQTLRFCQNRINARLNAELGITGGFFNEHPPGPLDGRDDPMPPALQFVCDYKLPKATG
jgi:hypothetical protein